MGAAYATRRPSFMSLSCVALARDGHAQCVGPKLVHVAIGERQCDFIVRSHGRRRPHHFVITSNFPPAARAFYTPLEIGSCSRAAAAEGNKKEVPPAGPLALMKFRPHFRSEWARAMERPHDTIGRAIGTRILNDRFGRIESGKLELWPRGPSGTCGASGRAGHAQA